MGLLGGILSAIPGIGSVFSAISNDKAIKKATKAQQAGIQQAIDEQRRQFDVTQTNFEPFREFGVGGVGQLGDLIGINGPEKQAAALQIIQSSPVLSRLIDQGTEGVLQNASATGGLRGGNTQRSLADFRADAFNKVLQDQIANLGGAVGVGTGATNAVANFGQHTADQVSSGYTSMGNSQFNSILGRQGVYNNMSNQIQSIIANLMTGGMGGMSTAPSDRRLKTNIVKVDEYPDGLGVYEWNWKVDPKGPKARGVIADEVEKLRPWAFVPNFVGEFAGVNYGLL